MSSASEYSPSPERIIEELETPLPTINVTSTSSSNLAPEDSGSLPEQSSTGKFQSWVWNHGTLSTAIDGEKLWNCNYCKQMYIFF